MNKTTERIIIIVCVCVILIAVSVIVGYEIWLNGNYVKIDNTPSVVENLQNNVIVKYDDDAPRDINAVRFVKQAYELRNSFAVNEFKSVDDLSVSAVVQYAFCYVFAGNSCISDIKIDKMQYRQATVEQIEGKVVEIFGSTPKDITKSDLFIKATNTYEMWQPNCYADVYAKAVVSEKDDDLYQIDITYYNDENKKSVKDKAIVEVKKTEDGNYCLAGLFNK